MKNIHLIPTDKPSRLSDCHDNKLHLDDVRYLKNYLNIYITSDEEIKQKELCYCISNNCIVRFSNFGDNQKNYKKIILTTDEDLIKDGVQAIDDEFLEWFVNNSSCEEVVVQKWSSLAECGYSYHIILPTEKLSTKLHIGEIVDESYPEAFRKEEPKQEPRILTKLELAKNIAAIGICKKELKQKTLEEAAERLVPEAGCELNNSEASYWQQGWISGYIDGAKWQAERMYSEKEVKHLIHQACHKSGVSIFHNFDKWFEQFKKK